MDTKRIEALREIIHKELFIGVPSTADMGDKLALLAMICYLTFELQKKKASVKHIDVIKMCVRGIEIDSDTLEVLAIMCEWFSQGCMKFPSLGIPAKEMPMKIKKIITDLYPF